MEAIKLITGIGEPLLGRVLVIDALRAKTGEVPLRSSRATSTPRPVDRPVTPHVSVAEVAAEVAAGARLLDVREDAEVAAGMMPGAAHVPLAQVLADPAALGADRVVVICQVGARARRAAEALRAAGADAVVLAGGMDAWNAQEPAR
jgi:adenylyltransferase/sulfurtransferase